MKFIDFFGPNSPPLGDVLTGKLHSPSPLMDSALGVSSLQGHEKEPFGDHLRGQARSPPLMDSSSSCVSYLHDHEKNHDEGASKISSAEVVVARDFFPLTPDGKGFSDTKEVGHPHPEIFPAQPKRKYMASPTDAETFIVQKKPKCNRTHKAKKVASGCDTEEDRRNGISTELVLLFDPYKIKKKLTQSDLGDLSRLLIGKDFARSHVLRWMSKETASQVESDKGASVIVRDADTCSEHRLVFMYWATSKSYVLKGGWIKQFVKRRGLAAGDEIGLYWDTIASKFHFSLLHKAN
ncbi:Peptidase A1 domain-containing protein [Psidium guajava]|nr:Peptidase A1 domain-containing protein [Psidium guajava]